MRKLILVLLAVACFGLVGCGFKDGGVEKAGGNQPAQEDIYHILDIHTH